MRDARQPLKRLMETPETKTVGEVIRKITARHYSVQIGQTAVIASSVITGDLPAGCRVLLTKSAGGKQYIHGLAGIPRRNMKEVIING